MSAAFSKALFEARPIVGIIRGTTPELLRPLLEAVAEAGLSNLEITMNSPGAAAQISEASAIAGSRMNIGAGTVTSLELLKIALDAGAGFIVTPVINPAVIQRCCELKVPIFPGAYTPTEIVTASDMGASMVKIFPAETLGPGFIKSVKAPLPHLKLMPTGGVDLATIGAFRKAGADGVGMGGTLFQARKVAEKDWGWLKSHCSALIHEWEQAAGA